MQPLVVPRQPSESPVEASGYASEEIRVMQRAVGNIFARWGGDGCPGGGDFGRDFGEDVSAVAGGGSWAGRRDLADRLSYVIGIHRALRLIFREPAIGYAWMRRPNAELGGVTPVELLLRGGMGDLERLRRYLDSVRGG